MIPLKTLSFAKTAQGFYDVGRPGVPQKAKGLLKLYNKVLLTRFSKIAPSGFRTGAEVVEQLMNARNLYDVVRIVMTSGKYVIGGSGDASDFALDLLDIAGLKSCVEGLAAAVE